MFEINVRHTIVFPALESFLSSESGKTDRILTLLQQLQQQITNEETHIMASIKDLQDEVTAEDTVIDSAVTLIEGLAAQVAALQPDQAAIDALAADIKAKSDALAAAVAANTPAAPAPPAPGP